VCISANAFNYVWIIIIIVAAAVLAGVGCFIHRCYRWRKLQNAKADADNRKKLNLDDPIMKDEYERKLYEGKKNIDAEYGARNHEMGAEQKKHGIHRLDHQSLEQLKKNMQSHNDPSSQAPNMEYPEHPDEE
jgi:FtsZ-interacting cell division protein ZipA